MLKKTLIALAVAAGLSVGSGPTFAANSDPDLVAKAEKEGSVMFYSTAPEFVLERMKTAFEKKYPKITMNFWRSGSSAMLSRLEAEETSGRNEADIISMNSWSELFGFKKRGVIASYKSPEFVNYNKEDVDANYTWFVPRAFFRVISYNTAALDGREPPKDWMDMTDKRFKGRVSIQQPMGVGNTYVWRYAMYQEYGDKFIERLAASDPLISNSVNTVHQRIVSGEALVASDISYFVVRSQKKLGAPVDAVYPKSGVPISRSPAAILTSAPHPSAARVFIDFLASKEGQEIYNSAYTYSLRKDVKNEGLKPLSEIKYVDFTVKQLESKFDYLQAKTAEVFNLK